MAEESQQAQTVPTEQEAEKPSRAESDSARENETLWNKTLEKLQVDLPFGESVAQLNGTTLLQVTDTAARISVPNTNALAWIERRLYGQITKAMKGVVGKDLDLQFVAAS